MDYLVTTRTIYDECCNNKTNILCCFVQFIIVVDIVHKTILWNKLEGIKVPFELRVVVIRLYENFISKFKKLEGW